MCVVLATFPLNCCHALQLYLCVPPAWLLRINENKSSFVVNASCCTVFTEETKLVFFFALHFFFFLTLISAGKALPHRIVGPHPPRHRRRLRRTLYAPRQGTQGKLHENTTRRFRFFFFCFFKLQSRSRKTISLRVQHDGRVSAPSRSLGDEWRFLRHPSRAVRSGME